MEPGDQVLRVLSHMHSFGLGFTEALTSMRRLKDAIGERDIWDQVTAGLMGEPESLRVLGVSLTWSRQGSSYTMFLDRLNQIIAQLEVAR